MIQDPSAEISAKNTIISELKNTLISEPQTLTPQQKEIQNSLTLNSENIRDYDRKSSRKTHQLQPNDDLKAQM